MFFRLLLCLIAVAAGGVAVAAPAPEVTFTRDIAPLLQQHCQECHRPGGGAPFALSKYEHVFSRRTKVLEAVEKRIMPPWKALPGYGDFAGERRLSDAEIATVVRWVAAGAPEGNPRDLPPPREFSSAPGLDAPDLVLRPGRALGKHAVAGRIGRLSVLRRSRGQDRRLSGRLGAGSAPVDTARRRGHAASEGRARRVPAPLPQPAAGPGERPHRAAAPRGDGPRAEASAVHAGRQIRAQYPGGGGALRDRGPVLRVPPDEPDRGPSPHAPDRPRDESVGAHARRVHQAAHPHRRLGLQLAGLLLLPDARVLAGGILDRADGGLGQFREESAQSQHAAARHYLGRADHRRDGPCRHPLHLRRREDRAMRLAGKAALISGGARGMGAVEARLFVQAGARVVIGDVLEAEGRQVEAEIRAKGGEAVFVPLDVTREADWNRAVSTS